MMGWETKKLGDVCEVIQRGISPKYIEHGGICVINQKCIRNHKVNYELARRHDISLKGVNYDRYIKKSDVLVNSTGMGTLGRVAQVRVDTNEPTTVDTHVTIVRSLPGKFYDDFFGYMLIKIEDEIALSGEGASGQTELSKSVLRDNFKVSFPTCIQEQKRIVTILDQTFADIEKIRANTEKNLKNARELFESYLQQVFSQRGDGWIQERMSNLFKIKHGFAFKGENFTTDFDGNDPIVLTPGNYYENGGLFFTEKNTKRYHTRYPAEFLFNKGDLTIVMTDLSSKMKILGKPAIIETNNILHNQRIGKFEFLSENVDRLFLYYFLMSNKFLNNIRSTATGTMVRHTAPNRILESIISYPSCLHWQKRIVESIEEIGQNLNRMKNVYEAKLEYIDHLKKSLLHQAFTGQLTKQEVAV